jgi:DNA polymerase III psi subunit
MKRDWDIIRDVLLAMEASSSATVYLRPDQLPQHDAQAVSYNMWLMNEAGLVNGRFRLSSSGDGKIDAATVLMMTNAGHELLNTIRNETAWSKIKDTFKTKGLDMTFDLVLTVGKKVMEAMLG